MPVAMRNLGITERVVRIVLGVVLFTFLLARPEGNWWGWLGLVPLATGLAGYCPIWQAAGVTTLHAPRTGRPAPLR